MSVGMLIIDMQVGCKENERFKNGVRAASEYVNEAARLLRERGHPVVHVQDEGVQGGIESENYAIVPEIEQRDTDLYVSKKAANAFWETELEAMLKERGVTRLIISGFAAEQCVLFTYNGAEERGFKPAILQHGVLAGRDDSSIQSLYLDRQVLSWRVVEWVTAERQAFN